MNSDLVVDFVWLVYDNQGYVNQQKSFLMVFVVVLLYGGSKSKSLILKLILTGNNYSVQNIW